MSHVTDEYYTFMCDKCHVTNTFMCNRFICIHMWISHMNSHINLHVTWYVHWHPQVYAHTTTHTATHCNKHCNKHCNTPCKTHVDSCATHIMSRVDSCANLWVIFAYKYIWISHFHVTCKFMCDTYHGTCRFMREFMCDVHYELWTHMNITHSCHMLIHVWYIPCHV